LSVIKTPSAEDCALTVLEVVPLVMRRIRAELRKQGALDLSVPQFRSLTFLTRRKGASLSDLADHVGLTLPSMSVMIDGLVERGLVTRQTSDKDRRMVVLGITERGKTTVHSAREATQTYLAGLFEDVAMADRNFVVKAMDVMRPIFIEEKRQ
jgi:DNA-binding MarR family transcriptional regulator